MAKSTQKIKTINEIKIPLAKNQLDTASSIKLPYNGVIVDELKYSLSFSCFDRNHELFNLGDGSKDGIISANWFLDLLDCLKHFGTKTFSELQKAPYHMHPVDWDNANASMPNDNDQLEYWQFRINKSRGRVIGFKIPSQQIFYVVWLDPHHNLTDSEGYGGAKWFERPQSEYERLLSENERLQKDVQFAQAEIADYEKVFQDYDDKIKVLEEKLLQKASQ